MTNQEKIDIINEVADVVGGEIRDDYSGRGMYGETCIGIVCDSDQIVLEEAAERGLRGASRDNMGLQYIVYWPSVKKDA